MNETIQNKTFINKPTMRIVKTIFKDKDGNIIGENNNEHTRHKTG